MMADPIWTGPVGSDARSTEQIVLAGTRNADGTAGTFVPAAAVLPDTVETGPVYPLPGHNLLGLFQKRVFGAEHRAEITEDDGRFVIRCQAGDRPAGVVLSASGLRWPSAMQGALALSAQGGSAGWGASLVSRGADAPRPAQVRLASSGAAVPLRGAHADNDLVLTCPQNAAEITITGVRIEPAVSPATATGLDVGTWVWSDAAWKPDPARFASTLARAGVTDVALMTTIGDDPEGAATGLRSLARAMRSHGGTVHFVEGDPGMVGGEGLRAALARVAELRRASRAAGLGDAALELDIEPNGLPGYAADPAAGWQGWATAVTTIAEAWGGKVVVDLPWWMRSAPGGEQALAKAAPVLSGIAVMNYRTDRPAIVANAIPWLEWGAAHEVPVRIALENGALKTEIHRTFVRSPKGELVVFPGEGRAALYASAQEPPGGAIAFSYNREVPIPPQRVSFCGDRGTIRDVRREVGRTLSAWGSFSGFKVHGLLDEGRCG